MKNNFKNVLYNAFGFIFPVAVTLFTTPYVVHKLTLEIYGIYVLAISLMGMMSFLDLGFGQGIVKFVSQYEAKNDCHKINQIISLSLLIYFIMGLLGCVLIIFLSRFLAADIFKISPEHFQLAVLSFRLAAFGFLVGFISGIFSNIPKGFQRYDIAVKIQNIIWACTTILVVMLLYFGKGLIEILVASIVCQIIGLFVYYDSSKKILPSLKIRLSFDKGVFKEIFGFSVYTSLNNIGGNVIFKIDKMIVGAFLGVSAVSYYQVAFSLAQTVNAFIGSISQSLFPAVSYIDAQRDNKKLKEIYINSTRYAVVGSLIIVSGLILLGDNFLSLWMGMEFARNSTHLILLLAIPFFFSSVSVVGYNFYNGLGKAKINMISSLVGAFSYIFAALFLIPKFGLTGAAMAFTFTLLPFPVYFAILSRLVNLKISWHLGLLVKSFVFLSIIMVFYRFVPIPVTKVWFVLAGFLIVIFSILASFCLRILWRADFLWLTDKLGLLRIKSK